MMLGPEGLLLDRNGSLELAEFGERPAEAEAREPDEWVVGHVWPQGAWTTSPGFC
jgi:hypothetical protein